jgi:hypothetical protein
VQPAIRIPANDSLELDIVELLTRSVGKTELPPRSPVQGLSLPSCALEKGMACGGEGRVPLQRAFPRVGFIVTNLETDNRAVVLFYNKGGKQVVKVTRLCCSAFGRMKCSSG